MKSIHCGEMQGAMTISSIQCLVLYSLRNHQRQPPTLERCVREGCEMLVDYPTSMLSNVEHTNIIWWNWEHTYSFSPGSPLLMYLHCIKRACWFFYYHYTKLGSLQRAFVPLSQAEDGLQIQGHASLKQHYEKCRISKGRRKYGRYLEKCIITKVWVRSTWGMANSCASD